MQSAEFCTILLSVADSLLTSGDRKMTGLRACRCCGCVRGSHCPHCCAHAFTAAHWPSECSATYKST